MWVPRDDWNLADKNRIGMLVSAGLWVSGGKLKRHILVTSTRTAGLMLAGFYQLQNSEISPRAFMIRRAAVCLFIIH
jgi:hypothetical protein